MNRQYLGDALDHWKGSVLDRLTSSELLLNLQVDPMLTDPGAWHARDFSLLADLLRVEAAAVIRHRQPLTSRTAYFAEIRHAGDLFLDPDTGIRTGKVKVPTHYVEPAELQQLSMANPARVIVVYQHVRAQKVRARLARVVEILTLHCRGLFACSAESATVALLFASRTRTRVDAIYSYLRHFYRRKAADRTARWRCA